MSVKINETQRGLYFSKEGEYNGLLYPGKYSSSKDIRIHDLREPFACEDYDIKLLLKKDSELKSALDILEVLEDEMYLYFADNAFKGIYQSGFYAFWKILTKNDFFKISLKDTIKVNDERLYYLIENEELIKLFDVIDVADTEICLHFKNGRFYKSYRSGTYLVYKKRFEENTYITESLKNVEVSDQIEKEIFTSVLLLKEVSVFQVEDFEKGLLFFDGQFKKVLDAGRYYYWNTEKIVVITLVDMRRQQLDISGQDIMSEDKVPLRLNFVCHFKVTDPIKVSLEVKDYKEQIYVLLQLILREYVGSLKLDELLRKKQEIGEYVLKKLKEKAVDFGVEFLFCGVKDIILPGEIKEILNTVLIAEKKAQANVISRREETASTRNLLNTAKLMEENPTLLRLKELEYIERLCEKIGTIHLNSGGNVLESLKDLLLYSNHKK